ncbi:hypothetical protein B0H16DRAFT_1317523, partial [Mycena metata]
ALHEIRHQLLVRTHKYKYKDMNVRGVCDVSRSNMRIQAIDGQVTRAMATYQVARKALVVLGRRLGKHGWEKVLKVLNADDVERVAQCLWLRRRML